MPESFDFATTDPGSGGENLAGDRLTQGADTLFVPAAYLVHGAAGGPYTRVEAGAGLPVAATQAGVWTVAVSGSVGIRTLDYVNDSVSAYQAGTWQVLQQGTWTVSAVLEAPSGTQLTSHALGSADALDVCLLDAAGDRLAAFPVTDNGGSLTVDAVSLPLPAGAATEATLSALNGKVTACDTGAVVVASGSVTVADGGGSLTVDNGGTFAVQAAQSGTWAVTDGGGSLTVDGTVAATQSGTWSVRAQDGTGNALTSAARGSERALSVQLVDAAGGQITSFAGTEYEVGDTAALVGVLAMYTTTAGVAKVPTAAEPLPVYIPDPGFDVPIRALSDVTDSVTASDGGGSLTVDGGVYASTLDGTGNAVTSHTAGASRGLDVCILSSAGGHLTAFPVNDNSGSLTVDDGGASLTVDGTVAVSGTVAVRDATATSTLSNVSGSASSVTLLASNADRVLAVIVNDSTADLYVKFGTTASTTSYSYLLGPADTLEVTRYTGRIDGIWSSAAGSARVTEVD